MANSELTLTMIGTRRTPWALLMSAVLVVNTALVRADVLNVPADYSTIQQAVDAALDNDVVVVADGVYSGPGNRDIESGGRTVTVRSANGPSSCIIDCQSAGRAFNLPFSVEGFTIVNGVASVGGGGGIRCTANTTIRNCVISNCAAWSGGGVESGLGRPTIDNCVITGNTAEEIGGGVSCRDALITNCVIANNHAQRGGGVHCREYQAPVFRNCVIRNNTSDTEGGGVRAADSSAVFSNCTFANNAAPMGGAIGVWAYNFNASVDLANCVFWGNTADAGSQLHAVTDTDNTTALTVRYSTVQGGAAAVGLIGPVALVWGAGNRLDDPLLDATLRLTAGSPAVDSGDPAFSPGEGETDIDGEVRVGYCRVDMGADESPFLRAGCIGNGQTDACNIADGTSVDCNQNLTPDDCDLSGGTSLDCNGNAIPDDCESDCNVNSVPDDCDISGGSSADCNGNGTPDDCIADERDCNRNGVPDECDIAGGASVDLNADGLPDECQLYVDDDNCPEQGNGTPANPFCTIQNGIDSSFDGYEVIVAPGMYAAAGNFDLNFGHALPAGETRAITVRGTDPSDPAIVAATVIDAGGM
ncbi:MAG: hypothetical protein HOP29_16445, partial [Phycisphaerales bacterium]|nr:hypothetical protein [Phycisphaerales bacterium]